MGIVRTVEWRLAVPIEQAEEQLRGALEGLGMNITSAPGRVKGSVSRSLRKNRWAAEIDIELHSLPDGVTVAVCRVDMVGNKHYAVLNEFAEALGDDTFDDRGVTEAVAALGKVGKMFGRKEVRHLRHLLHADENVLVLGQGVYEGKQGLIVLTDRRLFFFEKSLGSETIEEFMLKSISSLSSAKKLGGERLVIHASGNTSEIKQLFHGQADEIARRFRQLTQEGTQPAAAPTPAAPTATDSQDPLARLERLSALHQSGALSDDEFERLKSDVIGA